VLKRLVFIRNTRPCHLRRSLMGRIIFSIVREVSAVGLAGHRWRIYRLVKVILGKGEVFKESFLITCSAKCWIIPWASCLMRQHWEMVFVCQNFMWSLFTTKLRTRDIKICNDYFKSLSMLHGTVYCYMPHDTAS
jgi:hypothetical protein